MNSTQNMMTLLGVMIILSFVVTQSKLRTILMKVSEALAAIATVGTRLEEAQTEILAEIEKLKSTDPDISAEGQASVEKVVAIANALADIVPGSPTP